MNKFNILGALGGILLLFSSCAQTEFDSIPYSQMMGDSLTANYSIKQLIDSFVTNKDRYTDLKYNATNAGLFTCDSIKSKTDVIIKGVVTSSDYQGNVYKYITIQDFASKQAIKISINASGVSAIYPPGQRVWVRCNGLYIGKYAQGYQIGSLYYNHDKVISTTIITKDTVKVNGKDTVKLDTTIQNVYRKEPGRLSLPIVAGAIHAYGQPDTTLIVPDTMTIAEIRAAGPMIINRIVCIKNAFFTGRGVDYNKPSNLLSEADYIFAPSTNGVGYPQSREIQDGTGSMFISTSEYAKFATVRLPGSEFKGNITAIVGWYNDKKPSINPMSVTSEIYHQLTLRSLKDLGQGFEGFHKLVNK